MARRDLHQELGQQREAEEQNDPNDCRFSALMLVSLVSLCSSGQPVH